MLDNTLDWWNLLRIVAGVNVLAWAAAAWWLWREREHWPPDAWLDRRWQLLLSAGYVLGCGWRCLLPVYDVQRIVMVDSFWSSVIVGRSVATFAELCFAAQWALLLRQASRATGDAAGLAVSRAVLPLIATAEVFSWYSVLTTANIGHVVEESLWGLCALLLVVSLLRLWPRVDAARRPLMALWCVGGTVYVGYMFLVDVPMYWARWVADEALGRGYLSVAQGFADASARWVVSHDWVHWESEVVWMTAYFSVAVWMSIALALARPMTAFSEGSRRTLATAR
jgi:hypothetical protein